METGDFPTWRLWESNQQPFDSQAGTQSTEPHQPGLEVFLMFKIINKDSNWSTALLFIGGKNRKDPNA